MFAVMHMHQMLICLPEYLQSTDLYFLKKLLNLKNDDGFKMNEVLVSLWYIMGLWPLIYSMLLLPSGRRYLHLLPPNLEFIHSENV